MKDILKHNDFMASVHFSSEDEIFHGKILGIDDSITFEGTSVASLKKAFRESIDDYLSICEEVGKDPLKSYKGSFNIRIQPELHKNATFKSIELGISLNQFVEKAISSFMSKKTGSTKRY
ncbi:MAG: type II toxin-antitoxin system HicB family antitoxin [Saprospiraceae bacterium]|uniref:Type II toxin-antitoxin system HicB family antitoxin n=1 Tax=Candidatus Opimibacter skivensis TaxID=2982028 RepID=A0A9D7XSL0_9BACT|nr:type II toxin-antitoxin system HicB family antitoxin [Candidatus Opimibacter skivensis]